MGQDGIENKEMLHINKGGLLWRLSSIEFACNAGEAGSIPGFGRSPGEENGNPLQYSCLGNPMDRVTWVGSSPWGRKE